MVIHLSYFIFTILESILLVVALSTDAFVASFAYGTNKIKIPFHSVVVISTICSLLLAISLFIGTIVRSFITPHITEMICFLVLFFLGIVKLCDSTIKAMIQKRKHLSKELSFSFFHLSFILHVYANPEEADSDASKILSPAEAASLAVALSLDGLAVGFGAALADINSLQIILFSLIFNIAAVMGGCYVGNKIAEKLPLDLSWLSGVLLMALAVLKLK